MHTRPTHTHTQTHPSQSKFKQRILKAMNRKTCNWIRVGLNKNKRRRSMTYPTLDIRIFKRRTSGFHESRGNSWEKTNSLRSQELPRSVQLAAQKLPFCASLRLLQLSYTGSLQTAEPVFITTWHTQNAWSLNDRSHWTQSFFLIVIFPILIFCWPCFSIYLFINPYLANVENRVSS